MATFMVENSSKRSSSRRSDRPKPPTRVEDFAEEVINGIFCTYEPPTNSKGLPSTIENQQQSQGILRPPHSSLQERQGDKNVRWIDDTDKDVEQARINKEREKQELNKTSLANTCDFITAPCLDAGVKAGILSDNTSLNKSSSVDSNMSLTRESKAQQHTMFDEEGNPVSSKPGNEQPPPPPTAPPPNKREVFIPQLCGVELNIVDSSKAPSGSMEENDENSILANSDIPSSLGGSAADRAPPPPPPPPPATKPMAPTEQVVKKDKRRSGKATWKDLRNRLDSEDDWDGPDWMAESNSTDDSGGIVVGKTTDEIVRDRSDVTASDVILDRAKRDNEGESEDREDGSDRQEEDKDEGDWDETLNVIGVAKKSNTNKSLPTVEEDEGTKALGPDPEAGGGGKKPALARDGENGEEPPSAQDDDKTKESTKEQKRRSFFGRLKSSSGRDPSPGKPRFRSNDPEDAEKDEETKSTASQKEAENSVASENKSQNAMSLKERFRLRNRDREQKDTPKAPGRRRERSKSPGRRERSRSPSRRERSKSPSRFKSQSRSKKNLPPGLSWLSPRAKGSRGQQEMGQQQQRGRFDGPMPHLHPAHPLNQVRHQVQMSNSVPNMEGNGYPPYPQMQYQYPYMYPGSQPGLPDDQMSFITAHRRHLEGDQASQAGMSDYADRMSFITAHRNQMGMPQGTARDQSSETGMSDYADRMSYITAHRNHIGSAQGSQAGTSDYSDRMSYITAHRNMVDRQNDGAASDYDDRMSYITASRDQADNSAAGTTAVDESVERQSFIGDYRSMMEGGQALMDRVFVQKPRLPPQTPLQPQPQTATVQDQKKEEHQEASDEEKKEDDTTWEEKTKLAWERLRNGLGMTSDDEENSSPKDNDGKEPITQDKAPSAGQQPAAQVGPVYGPIFYPQAQESLVYGPVFYPHLIGKATNAEDDGNTAVEATKDTEEQKESAAEDKKDTSKEEEKESSGEETSALAFLTSLIRPSTPDTDNTTKATEEDSKEDDTTISSNTNPPPLKGILKTPSLTKKVTFGENDEKTFTPEEEEEVDPADENVPPSMLAQEEDTESDEGLGETTPEEKPQQEQEPLVVSSAEEKEEKEDSKAETDQQPQGKKKKKKLRKFFANVLGKGKNKSKKKLDDVVQTSSSSSSEGGDGQTSLDPTLTLSSQTNEKVDVREEKDQAFSSGTDVKEEKEQQMKTAENASHQLPVQGPTMHQGSPGPMPVMYQGPPGPTSRGPATGMYQGSPGPTSSPGPIPAMYQDSPGPTSSPGPTPAMYQGSPAVATGHHDSSTLAESSGNAVPNFAPRVIVPQAPPAGYYGVPSPVNGGGYFNGHHDLSIHDRLMQQQQQPSIHDRLMQQHPPSIHDRLMQQHPPTIHDRLMMQQQQPSIHDQLLQPHPNQGYFYSHQPHGYSSSMGLPNPAMMPMMPVHQQQMMPVPGTMVPPTPTHPSNGAVTGQPGTTNTS